MEFGVLKHLLAGMIVQTGFLSFLFSPYFPSAFNMIIIVIKSKHSGYE